MFEVLASIGRIIVLTVATASLASVLVLAVRILWEYLKYYLGKKYGFRLGKKPEMAKTFATGDLVVPCEGGCVYQVWDTSDDYIRIMDANGRYGWYQRHRFRLHEPEVLNLESLGQEYEEILNCQEAWESVHGTHDRS